MTLFRNKYRIESTHFKGWDYRNPAHYFVTICTHARESLLGTVDGDDVELSVIGEIAAKCWLEIPNHHQSVELNEWIVMPNHIHGIIVLTTPVESLQQNTPLSNHLQNHMSLISPKPGSLAVILRSYKSAVSHLTRRQGLAFSWQERFWDHIIRDEEALYKIKEYIRSNPANWSIDQNSPNGLWM